MFSVFMGIVSISASIFFFLASFSLRYPAGYIFLAVMFLSLAIFFFSSKSRLLRKQRKAMEKQFAQMREEVIPKVKSNQSDNVSVYTQSTPTVHHVSFNVAGVTYQNDNGSDRQRILRHLYFKDPPYVDDDGAVTAEIKSLDYDGQLAFAVFLNGYQVGFVPRKKIADVDRALDCEDCAFADVRIVGGGQTDDGEQINYGCMISLKYTE